MLSIHQSVIRRGQCYFTFVFPKKIQKRVVLTAISLMFLIPNAFADCNGFTAEINALAGLASVACQVGPAVTDEEWVADTCTVFSDIAESDIPTTSIGVWNLLADNGSATIGARRLDPGITESGKLVEPGHRVFLLSAVADKELIIDVNYEKGKAGLELDVCTLDPDGVRERVASFNDLRGNQQGLNETVLLEAGRVVVLKLKPLGNPLNAYKYDLTVTLNNLPTNDNLPVTTLEPNIDRPGRDYRNFAVGAAIKNTGQHRSSAAVQLVNSRWQCRRSCKNDPQCQAWTFVKGNDVKRPHCWLKDSVPSPVADTCCDSGVRN